MTDSLQSFLYQEDLYEIPEKVTVVLKRPWESYTPEQRVLLSKILASIKLSLSSVQIISMEHFDINAIPLSSSTRALVFGSTTDSAILPYQLNRAQGFTIIKADDLPELDDQKKKNLWIALKAMFTL